MGCAQHEQLKSCRPTGTFSENSANYDQICYFTRNKGPQSTEFNFLRFPDHTDIFKEKGEEFAPKPNLPHLKLNIEKQRV
jgi:hypothetical protein